jgi:hypothetical protein
MTIMITDQEAPNKQVKPKRPKISDAAKKGPRKAIAVQMGSEAQFPNAKGHVEMNEVCFLTGTTAGKMLV